MARHRKMLRELAKRRGLNLVKLYEEIVSGESIDSRPQMQELLKDVQLKKWDGVLVVDVDRLGRGDTREQGIIAEAFEFSKTWIITPTKDYNPEDEADMRYLEFGQFMSRQEYKTIQKRLMRGLLLSIQEGNYVGSLPPYGYEKISKGKTKTLRIVDEEARVVELMFDWFVNKRLGTGEIARRLTAMAIPTATKRREWARDTIRDILRNQVYTGHVRWNRRKVSKEFDGATMTKKKRRAESKDYLVFKGKHKPIISQELFDAAQQRFAEGSVPIKCNSSIVNPLAGLVCCSKCGKHFVLTQHAHQKNGVWRLNHPESKFCKNKSVEYDRLYNAVIDVIEQNIADFEFKLTHDAELEDQRQHDALLLELERKLKGLEKRRADLFDYFEGGIYSKQEFLERRDVLNTELERAEKALQDHKDSAPENIDYREMILKFSDVLETMRDDTANAQEKNYLLREIIERVDYWREPTGRGGYYKTRVNNPFEIDVHFK